VTDPQTEAELQALRRSVQRGQPYGDAAWTKRVAARLQLENTLAQERLGSSIRLRAILESCVLVEREKVAYPAGG
jgi:hypothetical protein